MGTTDKMSFRQWLYELWKQNCDEHQDFGELPYTQEEYFKKFKYWLKREYRHQTKGQ